MKMEMHSQQSSLTRRMFMRLLGEGKSAAATTLAPPPTNLTREQPDQDFVMQVVRAGVSGTALPAMPDQFSESDRAGLAVYVCSLYLPYDQKK
jgi:hypothetical protein